MAITLSTLPGNRGRLTPAAAASIARIDKQRGKPLTITSAYRSAAEQEALKKRWTTGGKYNRPPYLYKPAWYPPYPHSTGKVVDTSDIAWMLTFGRAHGWRRTVPGDVVHFEYFASLDKRRLTEPAYQVYYCTEGGPKEKGYWYKVGRGQWWKTRIAAKKNYWISVTKAPYGGHRTFAQIAAIKASGKSA